MEIIKENGKIWGVKKDLTYGVWHITKIYLGEYEENKETPKQKKTKKEND